MLYFCLRVWHGNDGGPFAGLWAKMSSHAAVLQIQRGESIHENPCQVLTWFLKGWIAEFFSQVWWFPCYTTETDVSGIWRARPLGPHTVFAPRLQLSGPFAEVSKATRLVDEHLSVFLARETESEPSVRSGSQARQTAQHPSIDSSLLAGSSHWRQKKVIRSLWALWEAKEHPWNFVSMSRRADKMISS